jgi:hypothetical protein
VGVCGAALLAAASLQGCLLPAGSGFDVELYVGSYVGTWESDSGESGAARIDITVNLTARVATLTLDFDGNYLGQGDPDPHTVSGTFDENGAHLRGQDTLFGNYEVLVAVDGTMVGVFRDVAGGEVPLLTYTGTLTANSLVADYDVVLADGTRSTARTELTKQ